MSEWDILDRHIAQAEETLSAAAGSSSLCTVSRSGIPMPGVKYPEGSWIALRDVRRSARTLGTVESAIVDVKAQWGADLSRHAQARSGPDWIAYLTGGIDALDALADGINASTRAADG